MVHFFTKMGKMPDLGFGTSYKDVLCPKLEKKPCKAKIGPSKCHTKKSAVVLPTILLKDKL